MRPKRSSHCGGTPAALVSHRAAGSFVQRNGKRHLAADVDEGGRREAACHQSRLGARPEPRRLRRLARCRATSGAASLLRPVASGTDRLLSGLHRNPFKPDKLSGPAGVDVDADELARIIPTLCSSYALHPAWDTPASSSCSRTPDRKERYGTLYRRVVHGRGGRPVGCYLYYGRPGGMAWVLQVLAQPEAVGDTLDSLDPSRRRIGLRWRARPRAARSARRPHRSPLRAVPRLRHDGARAQQGVCSRKSNPRARC